MALFGAPITHEDHVRRALLAALAVQRVLAGGGEKADRETLDLPVRIGIHTGPVVFGPVADRLPMDYTVIGDTANIAARLQALAKPGTICISQTVYEQVKNKLNFRYHPLGSHRVKNIVEPVRAYAVEVAATARRRRRRRWPLVAATGGLQ